MEVLMTMLAMVIAESLGLPSRTSWSMIFRLVDSQT